MKLTGVASRGSREFVVAIAALVKYFPSKQWQDAENDNG